MELQPPSEARGAAFASFERRIDLRSTKCSKVGKQSFLHVKASYFASSIGALAPRGPQVPWVRGSYPDTHLHKGAPAVRAMHQIAHIIAHTGLCCTEAVATALCLLKKSHS